MLSGCAVSPKTEQAIVADGVLADIRRLALACPARAIPIVRADDHGPYISAPDLERAYLLTVAATEECRERMQAIAEYARDE